ncbi:hypothetical protein GGR50DRAFT_653887 [Xylaria sp. CBS 124048]|nr:hypothetical protein GGR50DRAFT_653887 [Xylaria sp. CBS 124048]
MFSLVLLFPLLAAFASAAPCTTGNTTTTAGFPMPYYTQAKPLSTTFSQGYEPDPTWASRHHVGGNTFGVPDPIETGFAYAQFKCQYYCKAQSPPSSPSPSPSRHRAHRSQNQNQDQDQNQDQFSPGGSFFVRADPAVGSWCTCFNNTMDPNTFVSGIQTLVGAWNSLCET